MLGADALPVVCCQKITSGGQLIQGDKYLDPVLYQPDIEKGIVVRLPVLSQHFVPLQGMIVCVCVCVGEALTALQVCMVQIHNEQRTSSKMV